MRKSLIYWACKGLSSSVYLYYIQFYDYLNSITIWVDFCLTSKYRKNSKFKCDGSETRLDFGSFDVQD